MAPIPREPPVTMATFPVSENKLSNLALPNHMFTTSADTGLIFAPELIELTVCCHNLQVSCQGHKERQYADKLV